MILSVFAVYDNAVQAFLQPFYTRSKGEAVRSFTEAVNENGHQFAKHASDYYLAYLGEYDDHSGIFNTGNPIRIISALECRLDEVGGAPTAPNGSDSDRRLPPGLKLPM